MPEYLAPGVCVEEIDFRSSIGLRPTPCRESFGPLGDMTLEPFSSRC